MSRLEISVYSLSAALTAAEAGADRLELCAGFPEGGTTPTVGLLAAAKERVRLPVHVMVRPRGGDFHLTPEEVDILDRDIRILGREGADGFVFGALNPEGKVDREACRKLLGAAGGKPCVFHRAFDLARNPWEAMGEIGELGFAGLLTSGQARIASEGVDLLGEMVRRAAPGFEVIPGCGITPSTLGELHRRIQAPVYHASATGWVESPMSFRRPGVFMNKEVADREFLRQTVDGGMVRNLKTILEAGSFSPTSRREG